MKNLTILDSLLCVFFQAEDGIRDSSVTGVQTCALPISHNETCANATFHFTTIFVMLRFLMTTQTNIIAHNNPRILRSYTLCIQNSLYKRLATTRWASSTTTFNFFRCYRLFFFLVLFIVFICVFIFFSSWRNFHFAFRLDFLFFLFFLVSSDIVNVFQVKL